MITVEQIVKLSEEYVEATNSHDKIDEFFAGHGIPSSLVASIARSFAKPLAAEKEPREVIAASAFTAGFGFALLAQESLREMLRVE